MESTSPFDAPTNAAVLITAYASPTSQISSDVISATTGSSLSAPPVTYSPILPVTPSTVAPCGASSSLLVEIPVTPSMVAPSGASSSSLSVEVYDGNEHVDTFEKIWNWPMWYVINAVRVNFIYKNVHDNNLHLFLIDRTGDTFTAVVPRLLVPRYENMDLVGRVFQIHHFQLGYNGHDFPRYEGYSLHRKECEIEISKNTRVTPVEPDVARDIPHYPKTILSLRHLAEDRSKKRMIVDVIGRVIRGHRRRDRRPYDQIHVGFWELYIQDSSGQVMMVILHHNHNHQLWKTPFTVHDSYLVYISRVKLIHSTSDNFLVSNNLTEVEFNPEISL
uniref:uncharacterized protein LOC122580608 n=1 Tax=Erigeron canadensis TaxID=72917 RepID=UPI001CB94C09|nr:uncharacterized protein LOC122580608 [Erigeron canadensis]